VSLAESQRGGRKARESLQTGRQEEKGPDSRMIPLESGTGQKREHDDK